MAASEDDLPDAFTAALTGKKKAADASAEPDPFTKALGAPVTVPVADPLASDPRSQLPADPAALAVSPAALANPAPQGHVPTLDDARNWLEQDPRYIYGDVNPAIPGVPVGGIGAFSPFARDPQTGETHLTLPPAARAPLLGLLDVLQNRPFATINESGNPLSIRPTPNALALASLAASPVRMGAGTPQPATLLSREVTLSPEFKAQPVSAALDRPGASMVPGPTEANPYAAGIGTETPPTPTTAAEARAIAGQHYANVDRNGGMMTPEFSNKFIDGVEASVPQTEAGRAVSGQSEISSLAQRLQSVRDKPMSLQAAQEIDEGIGGLISKEYGVTGLSKEGKQLQDIQRNFRDQIANAGPDDVIGDKAGFDALVQARKSWSQAMKMGDLERIQQKADMTLTPATSIQNQVRTLLTSAKKSRGYSPDELSALQDAAERGILGNALHVFGSRLLPLATGAAETGAGGLTAGAVTAGITHVAGTGMRGLANYLQTQRLNDVMQVLGRSVPPAPSPASMLSPPGVSLPRAGTPVAPGPGVFPQNLLMQPLLDSRRNQP